MKVLLLGHKGMLGSDLMAQFKHRHEVIGMDLDEIDITSASECRKTVDEVQPQLVINAAAFTNVDACETDRGACFAVNAEAVKNIAEACRGNNITVIHYSTDYVFDGNGSRPYREDDPCNPINAYGASKLAGENYLHQLTDNFIIIRTAWLYGAHGKNFVQAILDRARATGKLTVVDDQTGSPTCTRDLAAATELLVDKNARGIFHITNRGSCTWFDFARKILKEARLETVELLPMKTSDLQRAARRPAYSVLGMQKFITTTGKTMQPWQLAFQDYYKVLTSRTCCSESSIGHN
ncbi:MAG: dTDP-4-dehydrorhamnose reductase [Deltaproteobacteria bacterium HGW-Deltaproteobacteria-5]|jgi:dTDP-4-dehydrorhamnose reductase|nr:MAG: dTDP-4-dehydrorhamnose reductase [Deltaproteobacteria bacterium HGW-Deltaproteobacteria-5]